MRTLSAGRKTPLYVPAFFPSTIVSLVLTNERAPIAPAKLSVPDDNPALSPKVISSVPVVLADPLLWPMKVFLDPVEVRKPVPVPTNVLSEPEVLLDPESAPKNEFAKPVLLRPALAPANRL